MEKLYSKLSTLTLSERLSLAFEAVQIQNKLYKKLCVYDFTEVNKLDDEGTRNILDVLKMILGLSRLMEGFMRFEWFIILREVHQLRQDIIVPEWININSILSISYDEHDSTMKPLNEITSSGANSVFRLNDKNTTEVNDALWDGILRQLIKLRFIRLTKELNMDVNAYSHNLKLRETLYLLDVLQPGGATLIIGKDSWKTLCTERENEQRSILLPLEYKYPHYTRLLHMENVPPEQRQYILMKIDEKYQLPNQEVL